MSAFTPLPLGHRIPASPHAVSCSLPTMRAVRGYEEKHPDITRHLTSGYPRFVVHPFTKHLAAHFIAATPALAAYTANGPPPPWGACPPRDPADHTLTWDGAAPATERRVTAPQKTFERRGRVFVWVRKASRRAKGPIPLLSRMLPEKGMNMPLPPTTSPAAWATCSWPWTSSTARPWTSG